MRLPWRREPRDVAALVSRVPRGGVAIDCGANVGQVTVTVAVARRCARRSSAIRSVVVEMHDHVSPELAEGGAALRQRLSAPEYANVPLDWR
jgi:hypothetical protein